jgi:antitoxin component of MazEF toxin-antitoxin module
MKVKLRRVGNSLGVILPKEILVKWGVHEGDELELAEKGLWPPARGGLPHQALDELKRSIALAVARDFTPRQIRAQTLANLTRWKNQGTWASAYDEWKEIALSEDDGLLYQAMLSRDDNSNRLRQSMPFVGLLSREEVTKLNEQAGR